MYGARLRAEFEARTGGTWPLNVGQVYTTLARLERDGLVEARWPDARAHRLPAHPAGRAEVARWWLRRSTARTTPRDELVIKLALAVTVPGVDVPRSCRPSGRRRCGAAGPDPAQAAGHRRRRRTTSPGCWCWTT